MDRTTMIFTKKLYQIVANNYNSIDFDYEKLCKELNLSRSQVYRCFQEENLGSPSAYLRQFRLEKAKVLLRETDPCSCSDPLNRTENGTFLFHDLLTVEGTSGRILQIISANNSEMLNINGSPITFPIALSETSLGSGVYQLNYYKRSNVTSNIVFQFIGNSRTFPFTTSSCSESDCVVPIPTMSQWGLLNFGLLVLNLGLFFISKIQLA